MNIRDALLENKNFVTYTLAGLVEVERDRILSSELATKSQLSSLSDVTEYMVKMAKSQNTDVLVNSLANLCTLLKSIQLPGDFERYAEQEEFYIALEIPYEDEKPCDLSLQKDDKKECPECPECKKENKEEDDDDCMECEDTDAQEVLAESVNVLLRKIANSLGDKGDHEAAYLVERTIRSINGEAENGKLLDKRG